jgi:hypothetical protein
MAVRATGRPKIGMLASLLENITGKGAYLEVEETDWQFGLRI